jgi:hypothetical protein
VPNGVSITLSGSEDTIEPGNFSLQFRINLYCDAALDEPQAVNETYWEKTYNGMEVVHLSSPSGCPAFSLNPLFISSAPLDIPFGLLLIALGCYNLLKGRKHIRRTCISNNSLFFTCSLLIILYYTVFSRMFPARAPWLFWVFLVLASAAGVSGSLWITKKGLRWGVGVMSGFAAFLASLNFCMTVWLTILSLAMLLSVFAALGTIYL